MEILIVKSTPDLIEYKGRRDAVVVLEDYKYDEGALRVIGEKKAPIMLVPLDQLLAAKGLARARIISKYRNFLRLCVRYGVLYALGFQEDAKSGKFAKREEDEIIALGMLLGLNRGQARMAAARFKDLFVTGQKK